MRVVHVKVEPFTHYIGRGWVPKTPTGKMQPIQANLGNPFGMKGPWGKNNLRQTVIESFETWARTKLEVMERIRALPEDAVLGCWCKPQACHGDVIIKIWKELHS